MVEIDEKRCIGCGICQNVCPEGFEVSGGKAHVRNENADCIGRAAGSCPRSAIITENAFPQSDPQRDFPGGFGRRMGKGRGRGARGGMGRGRWS